MGGTPITIRWLKDPTVQEINRVIFILDAAFEDDDLFTTMLHGGDKALVHLRFETFVHAAAIGGQIEVATLGPQVEDIVGVAVWYGPGQSSSATEQQREVGVRRFLAALPEDLKKWWLEHLVPVLEQLNKECLDPGFSLSQWYLPFFAVHLQHHRKGIAKALMASAEDKAKADGGSIVLETSTDVDVVIYTRLGFEVKGKAKLSRAGYGECQVHQMVKTP
ncbi:hypothetical protein Hypma_003725 [Hypsizygus marmoreus]|uniref:N-acetyltransferase domain-containing protein n=1 Tax=Hypsizygus marmoreus TaxID=39966 RepID=A0A369J311_HYPMA|nr:hypothetical protein Hypma_003725 [Hypsizygus marmoreus]